MHKLKLIAFAACFVVLGIFFFLSFVEGDGKESAVSVAGDQYAKASLDLGAAAEMRELAMRPSPVVTKSNEVTLFSHIPTSRQGMSLEDDPFVAESVAEQQWLDRNGYPNAEQMRAYSAATDGQLEQAAANGDSLAKVTLDSRRLTQGDESAVGRLMKEGFDGSMFALSRLAAYEAGAPGGNRRLAYSITRALEMAGDTRIALARPALFGVPLQPQDQLMAERDASSIYQRITKGGSTPIRDVRPYP